MRRGKAYLRKPDFRRPPATHRPSIVTALVALLFCLVMSGQPPMVQAEEENTDEIDALISAEQMQNSVNRALVNNKAELEDLEAQLRQLETLQVAVRSEIEAYESQNTVHGQLLLSSQSHIGDLEKAMAEKRLVSRILAERIEKFQKRHDEMAAIVQQSDDRIEISQRQIANILESQLGDEQRPPLEASNRELIKIFTDRY